MAKRQTKKSKKDSGPFLAAAFFCDDLIEDKRDGALIAVRIIDQIVIGIDPAAPPDVPSETNRIPVQVKGLITFRSGDSPGDHTLRMVMESPSGKFADPLEMTTTLGPLQHGGANSIINSTILIMKGGLFKLHVFLDGKKVTIMPLQITIQRGFASPPPSPVSV